MAGSAAAAAGAFSVDAIRSIRVSARSIDPDAADDGSPANRRTRTSTGAPPLNCSLPAVASQVDTADAVPETRSVRTEAVLTLLATQLDELGDRTWTVGSPLVRLKFSRWLAVSGSKPACSSASSTVKVPLPALTIETAGKVSAVSAASVLPASRSCAGALKTTAAEVAADRLSMRMAGEVTDCTGPSAASVAARIVRVPSFEVPPSSAGSSTIRPADSAALSASAAAPAAPTTVKVRLSRAVPPRTRAGLRIAMLALVLTAGRALAAAADAVSSTDVAGPVSVTDSEVKNRFNANAVPTKRSVCGLWRSALRSVTVTPCAEAAARRLPAATDIVTVTVSLITGRTHSAGRGSQVAPPSWLTLTRA